MRRFAEVEFSVVCACVGRTWLVGHKLLALNSLDTRFFGSLQSRQIASLEIAGIIVCRDALIFGNCLMSARKTRKGRKNARKRAPKSRLPWKTAWSQVGWQSFGSAVALWAAFAPIGLSWLAWFAPIGWISLIERPAISRREHLLLWLSGCIFWLPILQGIRLAYPPLILGWLALALYLAVYTPLFVAAARLFRGRGIPLIVAAPLAWVGIEVIRSYVITGYCANLLGHTQARFPEIIQISDQLGGYGVSYVMLSVSTAIYGMILGMRSGRVREYGTSLGVALALLLGTLGYGRWRLVEGDQLYRSQQPLLTAMLLQENTPTVFQLKSETELQQAWTRYLELMRTTAKDNGRIDLVVWPESTFTAGWPWMDPQVATQWPPELRADDVDPARVSHWIDNSQLNYSMKIDLLRGAMVGAVPGALTSLPPDSAGQPCFMLGSDAVEIRSDELKRYNSVLMVDGDGELSGRYDKMHLVMIGEYIPLGPLLQWVRDMFQLSKISVGVQPKTMIINGVRVSPNICFESMMPRVVSRQVRQLNSQQNSPDVLVNLTNDSWFQGASILDHHLACSIFCAVENRRPFLVAANSGLSAEIDGCGRLVQMADRFEVRALVARPRRDSRLGLVQYVGYPPAWLCSLAVLWVLASCWFFDRRRAVEGSDHSID